MSNNINTTVGLDLNSESAQQKLERFVAEYKELKKLHKELSKDPIMNASQIKQVDKEIAGLRNRMSQTKKETIDVKKVMDNLSGATLNQLEAALRKVTKEMKSVGRNTSEFQKLQVSQKMLKAEIDKTNGTLKKQEGFMSRMANGFSKYSGIITAALASWAGVVLGIKSAIDAYMQLDEKFADVMKTTGLTRKQVESLNAEIAKIDTRTSQQELLDLARVAGKLGITSEKDILGFVEAADQIAVALSEDLGGNVEESVNQLGKLVELFGLKDEFGIEQSLLKLGSTINSLGAAGTANEGYMVEFAKRVGGIAPMAGITIDEIFGLGATLDELGQTAEVSGTTITDVIGSMFKDTASFAEIAGMSLQDFTDLMNKDANEAFIKVLEGAKGSSGGFQQLALNLDALGIDGSRSIGVLSVLANNIDLLRERQSFANEEFVSGSSLTEEFNVKNNTLTGKLEKAKKMFTAMSVELGQKLQPAYASIISKGSLLIKSIIALVDIFLKYKNAIIPLVASIATYILVLKASELWSNTLVLRTNLLRKAKLAYGVAVKLLTGELKLATAWKKAFDAAGKTNIWALATAIIVGAAIALGKLISNMDKQAKLQKDIANAMKQTSSEYAQQKAELDSLLIIARDTTQSMEKRKEAMQQINAISPEYLGNLTLEKLNTDEARRSIVAYTEVLEQQAKVRALNNVLVEKQTDLERAKIDKESQSKIKDIEAQLVETQARMADATREMDRLNREAEMAATEAGGRTMVGESTFGAKEGDTAKDYNGTPIVYKSGKWVAVNVTKTTSTGAGGSGGSSSSSSEVAKAKEINQDIWEMAQFQESMIIDNGELYVDYLTQRRSDDQSYWSWKKEYEKIQAEKNKKAMLEGLELSKQEQLNILQEQYAKGEINAKEYEARKQHIIYSFLENEKAIRSSYKEDVKSIEQEQFDFEMDLLRRSYDQRIAMMEKVNAKRKEDLEKEKAELKQKYELYLSVASEMGETVGKIMGDTSKTAQERFKEVAKQLLLITLKTLKNQLTASIASATLQSIASAESVSSWGIAGVAKATLLTAALEGAYAFAASRLEGYSTGGPTGGSDPTRVAGLVHEKEYVIPAEGVQNPAIAKILTVIESARQAKKLSSLNWDTLFQMPGLMSGGNTSTNRVNPSARVSRVASSLPHSADPQLIAVLSLLSNKLEKLDEIEAKIFYDKQKISDSRITNSFNKSRLSD